MKWRINMALAKSSTIYQEMIGKQAAVIGFNCFNYESIAWAIEAADEVNVPVMVALANSMFDRISPEAFSAIAEKEAAKTRVPVICHLDHGYSFAAVMRAIKAGFWSVMIDCSSLPLEENIINVKEVVKAAHAMGVDVEAELGHVGSAAIPSDYENAENYTSVDDAARYTELTGIDSLAIAVGNAHGLYVREPKLDLERVSRLFELTSKPLVMHGGTDIPDNQLLESFRRGVCKVNIGTEFFLANYDAVQAAFAECDRDILDVQDVAKSKIMPYLRRKLLFSQNIR
jgi:ketose-bisphosphate aldolase